MHDFGTSTDRYIDRYLNRYSDSTRKEIFIISAVSKNEVLYLIFEWTTCGKTNIITLDFLAQELKNLSPFKVWLFRILLRCKLPNL